MKKACRQLISIFLILSTVIFVSCGNEEKDEYKFIKEEFPNSHFYIDTNGNIVSDNSFTITTDFNEDGFAYVSACIREEKNCKEVRGYIDKSFDFVGGKYWDDESLANYYVQSGNGVLLLPSSDNGGELIIMDGKGDELAVVNHVNVEDAFFDGSSDNGYIAVMNSEGKYGYVNKGGDWVINPTFSWVGAFKKGYAEAKMDGKYGLIDEKGEWVIEPKYNDLSYGCDCTFFRADIDADGNFVYIDKNENRLNDKQYSGYDSAPCFNEDLCAVLDGETHLIGYMNVDGEYVISPRFTRAENFTNGYAAVCEEIDGKEQWRYIDKAGERISDKAYDVAIGFSEEGYAAVKLDGVCGYIKTDGSWLLEPQFYSVDGFSNGYASVVLKDGKTIKK